MSTTEQPAGMSVLSQLTDEFQVYRECNFNFESCVYRSDAPNQRGHTTLSSFLLEADPANTSYMRFEQWYNQALQTLQAISPDDIDPDKSNLLIKEISQLYVRTIFRALSHMPSAIDDSLGSTEKAPLSDLESEIAAGVLRFQFPAPLVFLTEKPDHIARWLNLEAHSGTPLSVKERLVALDPYAAANQSTFHQLLWVDAVSHELQEPASRTLSPSRVTELLAGLEEHQQNIIAHVEGERLRELKVAPTVFTVVRQAYRPLLVFRPIVVMTAMMVLSLKLIYRLPLRQIYNLIQGLRESLSSHGMLHDIQDKMARDPRSYEKVINLDSDANDERFSICPKCSSSYRLNKRGIADVAKCRFQATPASKLCGQPLSRVRRGKRRPVLLFRRASLDSWMQNFLSRRGVIQTVDSAWERAQGPRQDPVSDFWGGEFVRQMKGPDGDTLFSCVPDNETRLLFSLAVDWFNPFHNKVAGKSVSTGVIVMSCLNLPPEERYKDENIYLVGLLPGRRQTGNLDAILKPLVNELLRYWTDGVIFCGIPDLTRPRLVRCALAHLICDLPAARKVAGFPGHSAMHNCSVCLASRDNMADLSSAEDPTLRRSMEDHKKHATNYRTILKTKGFKAAEKLLKSDPHAVRWSVLNELPYWDPVCCTVLDAMHLVLLGLCQFHWRKFWNGDSIPKSNKSPTAAAQTEDVIVLESENQGHGDDNDWMDLGESEQDDFNQDDFNRNHLEEEEQESSIGDPEPEELHLNEAAAQYVQDDRVGIRPPNLTAIKMQEARKAWLYGTPKSIQKLNTSQILCLLRENGGDLLPTYGVKDDLSAALLVCRARFANLPKKRPQARRKGSVQIEDNAVSSDPTAHISPSETLVDVLSEMEVPSIRKNEGTAGKVKKVSFITRSELDEIQMDMGRIVLPSWFTKVQPTFGEKANGKVKAAEWRSLFSVYLPLTLLRIWANSGDHMLHLKTLLSLSIVIQVVTSRRLSKSSMELYDRAINLYLQLISALSQDSLVVNHHLALHLSTFMRLHGPCHSHWAFPFERLIGKLQKVLHNAQVDNIPGTLSKAFTNGAMFKALSAQGVHTARLPRWCQYRRKRPVRQLRCPLNTETMEQLREQYDRPAIWASSINYFTHDKIKYSCGGDSWSVGNANIGYLTRDQPVQYVIGRINRILKIRTCGGAKEEIVFLVKRHGPPPIGFDVHLWDRVLAHRALGVKVVSARVEEREEVVSFDSIVGHVAVNSWKAPIGHVLLTLQLSKDIESRRRIP